MTTCNQYVLASKTRYIAVHMLTSVSQITTRAFLTAVQEVRHVREDRKNSIERDSKRDPSTLCQARLRAKQCDHHTRPLRQRHTPSRRHMLELAAVQHHPQTHIFTVSPLLAQQHKQLHLPRIVREIEDHSVAALCKRGAGLVVQHRSKQAYSHILLHDAIRHPV